MTLLHPWHVSEQQLKFQVSDLTLARARLPLTACEMAADTRAGDVVLPPERPLEPGTVGYLLRGVPLSGPRPLFERRDGFCIYTPHRYRRYFVDLRQSFADYEQGLRAKSRSTIRRKVKKFAGFCGGEIDFRVYRRPEEMAAFHEHARQVSAITYQEKLLDAGLPDDPGFADTLRQRAAHDGVRAYLLFHDGRPISYLLLTATDDLLAYDFLGFDPAYRDWSIGTVLHWLALQDLLAEQRFRMLDFTEGEGQQKRQFGTGAVDCANIYCIRYTARTVVLLRLHAGMDRLAAAAGSLAARLGLHARIRRLMRGQAA